MGKSKNSLICCRGEHTLNADARDVLPQPMAELNDEQRRALRLLAHLPDGCAQTALFEAGFSLGQLAGLVVEGFATAKPNMTYDNRQEGRTIVWMQITEAGRQAIAE